MQAITHPPPLKGTFLAAVGRSSHRMAWATPDEGVELDQTNRSGVKLYSNRLCSRACDRCEQDSG